MANKKTNESLRLQQASVNTAKLGFVFIGIYAFSTLIYRAWKLLTPDILHTRYTIILLLLAVNLTLWLFSRKPKLAPLYYQGIILLQIAMYIGIASYSIYSERGMASNSIILYVIPIVIIAMEYSAQALLLVTTICASSYALAAFEYFKKHPSEGYKVELYGGIVFYAAIMYLISALVWVLVRSKKHA